MLKKLIFLAIIGGLVYLNVTNPKQAHHEDLLLRQLQQVGVTSENTQERIFKDLDFTNFLVCSAFKTTDESKMVTLGYLDKVTLVHTGWIEELRRKHPGYFGD